MGRCTATFSYFPPDRDYTIVAVLDVSQYLCAMT